MNGFVSSKELLEYGTMTKEEFYVLLLDSLAAFRDLVSQFEFFDTLQFDKVVDEIDRYYSSRCSNEVIETKDEFLDFTRRLFLLLNKIKNHYQNFGFQRNFFQPALDELRTSLFERFGDSEIDLGRDPEVFDLEVKPVIADVKYLRVFVYGIFHVDLNKNLELLLKDPELNRDELFLFRDFMLSLDEEILRIFEVGDLNFVKFRKMLLSFLSEYSSKYDDLEGKKVFENFLSRFHFIVNSFSCEAFLYHSEWEGVQEFLESVDVLLELGLDDYLELCKEIEGFNQVVIAEVDEVFDDGYDEGYDEEGEENVFVEEDNEPYMDMVILKALRYYELRKITYSEFEDFAQTLYELEGKLFSVVGRIGERVDGFEGAISQVLRCVSLFDRFVPVDSKIYEVGMLGLEAGAKILEMDEDAFDDELKSLEEELKLIEDLYLDWDRRNFEASKILKELRDFFDDRELYEILGDEYRYCLDEICFEPNDNVVKKLERMRFKLDTIVGDFNKFLDSDLWNDLCEAEERIYSLLENKSSR